MDNLEFNAVVTDVKWVTMTNGTLNPVLVLDKEYEAIKDDDSQKFDGIMLKDVSMARDHSCGIGSKIIINCDNPQLSPDISRVITTSDKFKFPTHCKYCRHEVHSVKDQYVCINHLCIAQGRSLIFRLFTLANMTVFDRQSVVDLHLYLNEFPNHGDFSKVEHVYPYLKLLSGIFETIPTSERKKILCEKFGDAGNGIWLYECMLHSTLKKGLKPYQFWYVAGLPFTKKDYEKISNYDYLRYKGDGARINKLKLSKNGMEVIFDNASILDLMYQVLNELSS